MSFGSVPALLKERGLDLSTGTDTAALQAAVADAISRDLPTGFGIIGDAAARFQNGEVDVTPSGIKFVAVDVQPNTPEWTEVVRIMGTDVARPAIAAKLGVNNLHFLNCGRVIVSDQPLPEAWLVRQQIDMQIGPHC